MVVGSRVSYVDTEGGEREVFEDTVVGIDSKNRIRLREYDGVVHPCNIVTHHDGLLTPFEKPNQIPVERLVPGNILILAVQHCGAGKEYWLSPAIIHSTEGDDVIKGTVPCIVTSSLDDRMGGMVGREIYIWDRSDFLNSASEFNPFPWDHQNVSYNLLVALEMISQCQVYGTKGEMVYPASEMVTVVYCLLAYAGCIKGVSVSSHMISASITEYGKQMRSKSTEKCDSFAQGRDMMSLIHLVQISGGSTEDSIDIDPYMKSKFDLIQKTPNQIRNMIVQLGQVVLPARAERILSDFCSLHASQLSEYLVGQVGELRNAEYVASEELVTEQLATISSLETEIAKLQSRLLEMSCEEGDPKEPNDQPTNQDEPGDVQDLPGDFDVDLEEVQSAGGGGDGPVALPQAISFDVDEGSLTQSEITLALDDESVVPGTQVQYPVHYREPPREGEEEEEEEEG